MDQKKRSAKTGATQVGEKEAPEKSRVQLHSHREERAKSGEKPKWFTDEHEKKSLLGRSENRKVQGKRKKGNVCL